MPRAPFLIAMLFSGSLATTARAHGGPPAIENVVASDDEGPWLAELSEGFALREADGAWSFVCPALFAADTPPVNAAIAGDVWLSGGMDLFRLRANRTVQAADRPDLANARVLSVAALNGDLLALRLPPPRDTMSDPGSELVRLRSGALGTSATLDTVFSDTTYWSALVVQPPEQAGGDSALWLARIAGEGFELLELSADGVEIGRAQTAWPSSLLSIRLSTAGEQVFLHVFDNLGYKLVHVGTRGEPLAEGAIIADAHSPLRGPAVVGADTLLTQDDQLLVYRDGATELSDRVLGNESLTCLTRQHVCTPSRLYAIARLEADQGFDPDAAVLDLAELVAPTLRPQDAPELTQRCTAQWLVFQADLARAGIYPSDAGIDVGTDGGTDAAVDAGAEDAAMDAAIADDAGVQPDAAPQAPPSSSSGGCAVARRFDVSGVTHGWLLGLCAAAICLRRHPTAIYARRR